MRIDPAVAGHLLDLSELEIVCTSILGKLHRFCHQRRFDRFIIRQNSGRVQIGKRGDGCSKQTALDYREGKSSDYLFAIQGHQLWTFVAIGLLYDLCPTEEIVVPALIMRQGKSVPAQAMFFCAAYYFHGAISAGERVRLKSKT